MENQQNDKNFGDHELRWEKDRLNRLMEGFRKPLERVEVYPSPQEINAFYGEGFKVRKEPVTCMVYIFENQRQHKEAREQIKKYQDANLKEVMTSSNGRLFFWGYITENDTNAIYTLNDLAGTFAGEE
ncbi:hypothetical protein [Negadavirga shengliensis]|uniref:Uncharacterized protein n=1 Tax=Negadavirga shengliensis TaxID=1389218 RepID=A0ABV9T594_9BACT